MVKDLVFEGEAVVKFRLTQTEIDNILFAFCVLGHSRSRWAERTFVPGYKGTHHWELVSQGKTLCIYDQEKGSTHHLDIEKVMQGIRLWLEVGDGTLTNGGVDVRFDEDCADKIVQYGLFGEVRYE